jgi:hypothetical protein
MIIDFVASRKLDERQSLVELLLKARNLLVPGSALVFGKTQLLLPALDIPGGQDRRFRRSLLRRIARVSGHRPLSNFTINPSRIE